MDVQRKLEDAQWLPFSRANMAAVLDVPLPRLNNWLDRNRLWQTDRGPRFRRAYALREVFDIGGFAAMRMARIPEQHCARYIFNFGIIRSFWHGTNQTINFDLRDEGWSLGSYDRNALLTISINVRTLGESIFKRISELTSEQPNEWPEGAFESFKSLYLEAVELDRLENASVPLFGTGDRHP